LWGRLVAATDRPATAVVGYRFVLPRERILKMKIKMKMKIVFPLVATLLISLSGSADSHAQFGRLFGGGAEIETIQTKQLSDLINKEKAGGNGDAGAGGLGGGGEYVLVDVRSDAEVNVSIIPGAITKAEYERNPERYQNKTVIVYCTVGGRSGAYAKQLAGNGIKVKNYKGSILEWVNAELPLQTLDGQPTNRVHTYSNRYRVPAKYEQVAQ
jgi:rhodanese-related sulfurtransferase